MSKPSTLPRWATGGSAGIVTPPSGKLDVGFVDGEHPPAEYFNWLHNIVYTWLSWIDGFFTTAGAFTTPAGQDITAGGDLISTGDVVSGGAITSAANGDITAGAGGDVKVSGAGEFKHGDLTIMLGAALARDNETGTPTLALSDSINTAACLLFNPASGDDAVFSIPLKIGDRIKSIKAWIKDDNIAGHTWSMYFHHSGSTDFVTDGGQIGATQVSAHNGTIQALTLGSLTTTLASGNFYEVVLRAGAASATMVILGVEVTYDRP